MKTIEISKRKYTACLMLSFLTGIALSWVIRSIYIDTIPPGTAFIELCCFNPSSTTIILDPAKSGPYI